MNETPSEGKKRGSTPGLGGPWDRRWIEEKLEKGWRQASPFSWTVLRIPISMNRKREYRPNNTAIPSLRCGRTWGHSGLCHPLHGPTQLSLGPGKTIWSLPQCLVRGAAPSPGRMLLRNGQDQTACDVSACTLSWNASVAGGGQAVPLCLGSQGLLPEFWTCSGVGVHLVVGTGVKG